MASKYRSIQLLRNETINSFASHEAAIKAINGYTTEDGQVVASVLAGVTVKDGELVLYRYKLTGDDTTIHTQVVAAHVAGEGDNATKNFEIVANYDQLTNLVNSLNANITSEENTNVKVQVVEVDGKITEVHVTDNSINATDLANAINALDGSATVATVNNDVVTLYNVNEVDGIISQGDAAVTLAKVAKTGAAEDVSVARIEGMTATNVQDALEELQGDIDAINGQSINAAENQAVEVSTVDGETTIGLKLVEGEKVLSQTANGLKTNLGLVYDSTNKLIKLTGKTGEGEGATAAVIASIPATDFIKDGMLSDATIVSGTWTNGVFAESETGAEKAIKFVWKTYQQGQTGQEEFLKTEYLNVESLVDAYTAGNGWVVINPTNNTISHKEQSNLPTTAQGIVEVVNVTGAYAETKTFKVPQLTVDAAGHVTAVNEKEVSITLPSKQIASDVTVTPNGNLTSTNVQAALEELQGDINNINAVEWTGDAEINVDNAAHTIKHTAHTVELSTSTNGTAVKAVVIPQLTVNDYGHVTAIDNKTFNIDCNVTTVSGTAGQIVVSPTEAGEDVNYQVSLANVTRTDNPTIVGETYTNSFADNTPGFNYVRAIRTDNYGRVIGVDTVTMNEDINAGTY